MGIRARAMLYDTFVCVVDARRYIIIFEILFLFFQLILNFLYIYLFFFFILVFPYGVYILVFFNRSGSSKKRRISEARNRCALCYSLSSRGFAHTRQPPPSPQPRKPVSRTKQIVRRESFITPQQTIFLLVNLKIKFKFWVTHYNLIHQMMM
jgi:hypothetical protein